MTLYRSTNFPGLTLLTHADSLSMAEAKLAIWCAQQIWPDFVAEGTKWADPAHAATCSLYGMNDRELIPGKPPNEKESYQLNRSPMLVVPAAPDLCEWFDAPMHVFQKWAASEHNNQDYRAKVPGGWLCDWCSNEVQGVAALRAFIPVDGAAGSVLVTG